MQSGKIKSGHLLFVKKRGKYMAQYCPYSGSGCGLHCPKFVYEEKTFGSGETIEDVFSVCGTLIAIARNEKK